MHDSDRERIESHGMAPGKHKKLRVSCSVFGFRKNLTLLRVGG
jgi:hypothetical protein